MIKIVLISMLILLSGCSDNAQVFIYDKDIQKNKLKCLNLIVFPPNHTISSTLKELYTFSNNCKYDLIISYKNSISCNSNQNAEKKATGMPVSYIRFEIKNKNKLLYTYYKDLYENINKVVVKDGFKRIKKNLF